MNHGLANIANVKSIGTTQIHRWFGHVERRPVDSVVKRVDPMEGESDH